MSEKTKPTKPPKEQPEGSAANAYQPEAIEEAYLKIFSQIASGKTSKVQENLQFSEIAQELEASGLLRRETFPMPKGGALFLGWRLTYSGRLEFARLLRERRERVWWRKSLRALWLALLVIIPATWTVIAVVVDILRDDLAPWLRALLFD